MGAVQVTSCHAKNSLEWKVKYDMWGRHGKARYWEMRLPFLRQSPDILYNP
jgi:hypothetical protein